MRATVQGIRLWLCPQCGEWIPIHAESHAKCGWQHDPDDWYENEYDDEEENDDV